MDISESESRLRHREGEALTRTRKRAYGRDIHSPAVGAHILENTFCHSHDSRDLFLWDPERHSNSDYGHPQMADDLRPAPIHPFSGWMRNP